MSVNDSLRKFWDLIQIISPIEEPTNRYNPRKYASVKFANYLASVSKDIFGVEFTRMKVGDHASTRIEEESSSVKTTKFYYKDYSDDFSDYIHDDVYTLEYSNESNNIIFSPTNHDKLPLYASWIYNVENNIAYYVIFNIRESFIKITKFNGDTFVESTFDKSFTIRNKKTIIVNDSQYQPIYNEIYQVNSFGKLVMEEALLLYFDNCTMPSGIELFLQHVISSSLAKALANNSKITNAISEICNVIDSTQTEFGNKINELDEDGILYLILKYTG